MTSIAHMDLSASIGGFFQWWKTELIALVPDRLRRSWTRRSRVLVVEAQDGLLSLRRRSKGAEALLARVDPDLGPAAGKTHLAGHLSGARKMQLVLRLATGDALVRQLDFPDIAAEDLRQALRHEVERQSPLPADKVVAGYHVQPSGGGERKNKVWLVTVPRSRIARPLDFFTAIGHPITTMEISDRGQLLSASLLEPRANEADTRNSRSHRLSLVLLVIAALLAAAAVWIPLHRQADTAARLATAVAEARKQAELLPTLEAEWSARHGAARFLTDRREKLPRQIDVLAELTDLLPDSVWLSHLRIAGSEVQLSGYAVDTAQILALIEASPRFANVQFRASVTREADSGVERFEISAQVEERDNP